MKIELSEEDRGEIVKSLSSTLRKEAVSELRIFLRETVREELREIIKEIKNKEELPKFLRQRR